jgi:hypothetical protein
MNRLYAVSGLAMVLPANADIVDEALSVESDRIG